MSVKVEAMCEARDWYTEKIVQVTLKTLKKNGFTAFYGIGLE